MSLLLPDSGLLFWMFVAFGIVFVILAKYGFPVIIKMVEGRKTYIDQLTVERAIKLTEYFKESALNVQNILNENTLNSQQQTIVNLLPPSFTTAQAIQIAEQNGMKERTFQRFLNDNIGTLFRKEKHGEYSKINP